MDPLTEGDLGLALGGVAPWITRLQVRLALRTRIRNRTSRLAHSPAFAGLRSVPAGLSAALVLDGIRGSHRAMCASAPGGSWVELDGVTAGVMPATPEVAVLNSVIYTHADALSAAYDELATTYEAAGVRAWTVWVPAADRRARKLLRRAGHRLAASPTAMAHRLEGTERPSKSAPGEMTSTDDLRSVTALCDRVFGVGTAMSRAYPGGPPDSVRAYVAYLDGEAVSSLLTCDHHANCVVDWVATAPEARRRGLSTSLVRRALAEAATRGCTTSTLVATPMGKRGYGAIGYRGLGPLEQWERGHEAG